MQKMGFSSGWCRIVMSYICTVRFTVIINGQPGDKFAPSRGLKQGDPLSLYLFLLVTEVLSCMIQAAVDREFLDGVQMSRNGLIISHLFFANDMLLFLKTDKKNCHNLVQLLHDYYSASRQAINFQKSNVFFNAKIPSNAAVELGSILRMNMVSDPKFYLGVPAV